MKVFALWILIISVGVNHFFYAVKFHFSEKHGLHHVVRSLKEQLRREEMRAQLIQYQMRDFQQTVATLLPSAAQGLPTYQKRTIASLVVEPDREKLKLDLSSHYFEKGKTFFRNGNYKESEKYFKELIAKYPLSQFTIEGYFLLLESEYNAGEVESSIETINTMIDKYPEHDLTGFALLRLGQIFVTRERVEEAEQIYKMTLKEFENPELQMQANRLLKEISL